MMEYEGDAAFFVGQLSRAVFQDALLVEFMYLVSIHMPGESYRRRLKSLLVRPCGFIRVIINFSLLLIRTVHVWYITLS